MNDEGDIQQGIALTINGVVLSFIRNRHHRPVYRSTGRIGGAVHQVVGIGHLSLVGWCGPGARMYAILGTDIKLDHAVFRLGREHDGEITGIALAHRRKVKGPGVCGGDPPMHLGAGIGCFILKPGRDGDRVSKTGNGRLVPDLANHRRKVGTGHGVDQARRSALHGAR